MKNYWSQDRYLKAYRFAAEKHTNEFKKSKKSTKSTKRISITNFFIYVYFNASSIAFPKSSGNEIPASLACCGKILSLVNPGTVFISSI